jgi:hypothetical protein
MTTIATLHRREQGVREVFWEYGVYLALVGVLSHCREKKGDDKAGIKHFPHQTLVSSFWTNARAYARILSASLKSPGFHSRHDAVAAASRGKRGEYAP